MFRHYYEEIINYLLKGTCWSGASDVDKVAIRKRASKYKVINGVLYHKGKGRGIEDLRLVATTPADQQNAIRMCHLSETDGRHYGVNKTASLLACRYYWRMMYTDVIKYINKCSLCGPTKGKAVIESCRDPETDSACVWQMLEVEVLLDFHIFGKRIFHFLRVVDVHSKWTTFLTLEDETPRAAVRALFKECSSQGFPLAFRFVSHVPQSAWPENFVTALHQEMDTFSSLWTGQNRPDMSVHIALEEDKINWQPAECMLQCQEVINSVQSSLYVFFGYQSMIDPQIHDWHDTRVQTLMREQPYLWPQKLVPLLFHLRNELPPGMDCSPASLFRKGNRGDSQVFLPICKPTPVEASDGPLVAQPCGPDLLAQSCYKVAEKPKLDVPVITESQVLPSTSKPAITEKISSGKRKPDSAKAGSSSKRPHGSSSKSTPKGSKLSRQEQKVIDAGIMEAVDSAISRGLRQVEKKKKKNGKKNSDSAGLFDIVAPVPGTTTPRRPIPGDISGGMSSLEALKAVTGAALPQQVPPSPRLPSSSAAGEDHVVEEASPGRYSFRQNLKAVKGTSHFIQRLMAKSSSKRFIAVQNTVAETAAELNWDTTPPKIHHSELNKTVTPELSHTTSPTDPLPVVAPAASPRLRAASRNSPLLCEIPTATEIPLKSPLASPVIDSYSNSPKTSLRLSSSSDDLVFGSPKTLESSAMDVCEDLEPNLNNLGLSKAEEDLIDQTIKGVDQHIFLDADKMVGDDVLTVDDISKDDLGPLDVSNVLDTSMTDSIDGSSADAMNATHVNLLSNVHSESLHHLDTTNVGDKHCDSNDQTVNTVSNAAQEPSLKHTDAIISDVKNMENVNDTTQDDLSELQSAEVQASSATRPTAKEIDVNAEAHFSVAATHPTEAKPGENIVKQPTEAENSDTCSFVYTIEMLEEGQNVQLAQATTDVIYDALDTCATFVVDCETGIETVADSSLELSEENTLEDDFEKMTQKISQDLASGRTIDKLKSVQNDHNSDSCVTASEDMNSIASVCDALLTMASPPIFSPNAEQVVLQKPENNTENVIQPNFKLDSSVIDPVKLDKCDQVNGTAKSSKPLVVTSEQTIVTPEHSQLDTRQAMQDIFVAPKVIHETDRTQLPLEQTDSSELKLDEQESMNTGNNSDSELCLPSDFFIDEDLLVEAQRQAQTPPMRKPPSKVHAHPKLSAEQDIVSILNSIMSNRAFMDDPVARAQREAEDREYMKEYGLRKLLGVKVTAMPENVLKRAEMGPVPVRTIHTCDRRTYYVGNMKVDEVCLPKPERVPSAGNRSGPILLTVLTPKPSGQAKSILNLKGPMVSPSNLMLKPTLKTPAPVSAPVKRIYSKFNSLTPKEVTKSDGARSMPHDHSPAVIKKVNKRPFGCPICPRTYVLCQDMLNLHVAFHLDNARNLHCPVCGKSGTVWPSILKHYIGHPQAKENASLYEMILATCDKDRTLCGQCDTLFVMRQALIRHLETEHVGERVNGSRKFLRPEEQRMAEKKNLPVVTVNVKPSGVDPVDATYLCPNCPYSTKTHYNLVLHGHECQGTGPKLAEPITKFLDDLSPQFKCSLCKFSAVSSKQLEQHMRLQHRSEYNRPASKMPEGKHCCVYCTMKFMTIIQLHSHMNKHKEASMFMCKACNYTCRYKKIMHRHANKNHPNVSLKGLIQAPKKLKFLPASAVDPKRFKQDDDDVDSDEPMAKVKEEVEEEDEIPTATVVVHTDENGELVVCDEDEASSIPLEPEETTYLLDSSTLDGNAVTLDGNMIQIIQGDNVDGNGQSKVLLLSVGPQELDSLNSGAFTLTEGRS